MDIHLNCYQKYEYENTAAHQLRLLFNNLEQPDIFVILNKYSNVYCLKYGDAIKAMLNSKLMVKLLTLHHTSKVAQKQKQSILTSFLSPRDEDKQFNNSIMYGITDGKITDGKINKHLMDKLIIYRKRFHESKSLYLYDSKIDGKYKEYDKVNPKIKDNIKQYWEDQTAPSPHTNDTIITDHTTGAKPGDKPTHTRHNLQGIKTEFYIDWKLDVGNTFCDSIDETVPDIKHFAILNQCLSNARVVLIMIYVKSILISCQHGKYLKEQSTKYILTNVMINVMIIALFYVHVIVILHWLIVEY